MRKLSRRTLALAGAAALAFIALNLVAYRHAVLMVEFGRASLDRTPSPDRLSAVEKMGVLLSGVSLPRPVNRQAPSEAGLAYSTRSLRSADGTELEAWLITYPGSHGTAVILPGYNSAKSQLLPEARAFVRLGYDCLLLDFRGTGGSQGAETTLGWKEAEDAAAALRDMRASTPGRPVFIFAKSMGAAAALRMAGVLGEQPDAMVLQAPFDSLYNTSARRFRKMGLPGFPFADLILFWGGRHCGFPAREHEPARYAASVRCPVLLMSGGRDPYVTPGDSERIARSLGEHGRLVIFPGSGHDGMFKSEPEKWEALVKEFLAGALHKVN
ncbi:MAG: alpha/beta fold hydrolase [Elusimicrobia bacterium]|nr:alpha/beta fold hydrolase [Elusimicrobiota bacterium]